MSFCHTFVGAHTTLEVMIIYQRLGNGLIWFIWLMYICAVDTDCALTLGSEPQHPPSRRIAQKYVILS